MLLYIEAAALALLTVVLAGPVSTRLSGAAWATRAPRAALVLWQAIGLGGGLGVLTAGLTLAAAALADRWLPGVLAIPRGLQSLGIWGWIGISLTIGVGVYLVAATLFSAVRVYRARREHRTRLAMISRALPQPLGASKRDAPVRLLEHPHAVAYGLPGLRPQVVLTRGALDALTEPELAAVLAHEQAHARGRHDLVVQPFIAWARTFPFLRSARRAVVAVGGLVEMLADDAALARCSRHDLRNAVGKLAGHYFDVTVADAEQQILRDQLRARRARLAEGAPAGLAAARRLLIYAVALATVLAPPLILLAS